MPNNNKKYIIVEEITKSEIDSMISNHIQSNNNSNDLKKTVKKIVSDCLVEFTKSLWNKRGFWQSEVER